MLCLKCKQIAYNLRAMYLFTFIENRYTCLKRYKTLTGDQPSRTILCYIIQYSLYLLNNRILLRQMIDTSDMVQWILSTSRSYIDESIYIKVMSFIVLI